MKNIARTFFALWYLLGWMAHVYLALGNLEMYRSFGKTALFPSFHPFWEGVIMPNIRLFALLLAAFELVVGLLIASKNRLVKLGLSASILFNLFLIQLGLSYPASDWKADFLANRLPNLLFIFGQVPLLFTEFDWTIPEALKSTMRRK